MKNHNFRQAGLVPVFLCLAFLSCLANAETRFVFGGLSIHTTSDAPNNFHRTALVKIDQYFGGYFRNSFDDDSFAVGRTYTDHQGDFDVSLHAGLVYGYRDSSDCYKTQKPGPGKDDPKIICPLLAPEVRFNALPLTPSISWYGLDAIVLNFEVGF